MKFVIWKCAYCGKEFKKLALGSIPHPPKHRGGCEKHPSAARHAPHNFYLK